MNILVVGTNWIGDAVMTIPAVRKLRRLFPEAKIVLLTRPWASDIFANAGLFDEIITTASLFRQISELRSRSFDLAVVFPNSFRSALATRLGGVRRTFGYGAERRSFLLTDPVAVPEWKKNRHEVFYYLELAGAVEKSLFGKLTDDDDLEPHLTVPEADRLRAKSIFERFGIDVEQRIVALAPGSTNSRAKRWLPERFAELNDRLRRELGANVILLGSKDERPVAAEVSALAKTRPIDLTGATDLASVAAVLAEVDLLVSNDMGLAHLAAAVGTPTIVIFGPTDPVTTRPYSDLASVVSANVECSPCMLRDCPIDHRCMTRVGAGSVFEKAVEVLNNGN